VSVNSVNIVHSVNKVVNPHKDNYQYVGGGSMKSTSRCIATDICRLSLMWEVPTALLYFLQEALNLLVTEERY
jgi:hypothetical protein